MTPIDLYVQPQTTTLQVMAIQCVECDKFIQERTEDPVCPQCAEKAEAFELVPDEQAPKLKCYFRKNKGFQCEEFFESKTFAAIKRRNQLLKHGYGASIHKFGYTTVGKARINLTMVISAPGSHDDTNGMPTMNLEVIDGCRIEKA